MTDPPLLEPLTMSENHEGGGENKLPVLLQRLSSFLMDVSWTSDFVSVVICSIA